MPKDVRFLANAYQLTRTFSFVCSNLDTEYLLFDRKSGDTILLDPVSLSILNSLSTPHFTYTPEAGPAQLDLNSFYLEDIQPHLDHLMDMGLIAPAAE
tara:strand:- start:43543 stop:43836 length:294 start_codon:yes stop_codon:yes gene_type:complete